MKETLLQVPYYSQYLDLSKKEHALTACGMTCVYMGLKYYGKELGSLDQMVEKGKEEGGFGPSGWIHDYLVETFKKEGIFAERMEKMEEKDLEKIKDSIKSGDPVLASVEILLFDKKFFHIVILIGVKEESDGSVSGFFYHDPASNNREKAKDVFVDKETFMKFWRKMAIFPHKDK